MAIRITEDGTVVYENEPDVNRELFPNLPGGYASPEQITQAVYEWLENHPEATTTVTDGSITREKLDSELNSYIEDITYIATGESVDLLTGESWELGSVNSSTGADSWSQTRIRTGYIPIPAWATYIQVSCDSGWKYFATVVNAEKTAGTFDTNFQTRPYTINLTTLEASNRAYIRYVLQRTDNTIDISDYVHAHMLTTPNIVQSVGDIESSNQYQYAVLLTNYNKYIDYNSDNGAITIPRDTIYIGYNVDGSKSYKILNNASDIIIQGVTVDSLGTSAVNLILDVSDWSFSVIPYTNALSASQRLVASIRLGSTGALSTPTPWSVNGRPYRINVPDIVNFTQKTGAINSINHRGFNTVAPENTLPAFKLSRKNGFDCVETDIQFTLDDVPVCLHDLSINRTAVNADGTSISQTINISDITYEQALNYVFCAGKYSSYPAVKLPTFEEFLKLCKAIGLKAYVELKSNVTYTQAQITTLVNMVKKIGLQNSISWISSSTTLLGYVKNANSDARLGVINTIAVSASTINAILALKTDRNEVFLDIDYTVLTSEGIDLCYTNDIPVEVWTVNSNTAITALDDYVTGVTSDNKVASDIFYTANID